MSRDYFTTYKFRRTPTTNWTSNMENLIRLTQKNLSGIDKSRGRSIEPTKLHVPKDMEVNDLYPAKQNNEVEERLSPNHNLAPKVNF